ncbi:hypothetical protein PUN28_002853 [Cardiocondyla obscurior]|uniref:Uncharacterized protein n=1 Tax=Cardiocondyla obscurior TaxID=286306 RepID=A0AAW2GWB6_9HYME
MHYSLDEVSFLVNPINRSPIIKQHKSKRNAASVFLVTKYYKILIEIILTFFKNKFFILKSNYLIKKYISNLILIYKSKYPRSSSSCSASMEDVGRRGSLNNQKPQSADVNVTRASCILIENTSAMINFNKAADELWLGKNGSSIQVGCKHTFNNLEPVSSDWPTKPLI